MKGYKDYQDWERDAVTMKANPNDLQFLQKVIERVDATSEVLRAQIREEVETDVFEKDPITFFEVTREHFSENSFFIVATRENPWFEV